MPERSFGRTVRYRRTKLGMSQARLGQLVGRSAATIRSWESDKAIPNDPVVLSVLAAVIGIDERTLYDKAGVERPVYVETSPTIEEALASLAPTTEGASETPEEPAGEVALEEIATVVEPAVAPEPMPLFDVGDEEERRRLEAMLAEFEDEELGDGVVFEEDEITETIDRGLPTRPANDDPVPVAAGPVLVAPAGTGSKGRTTVLVPAEASYIEDPAQKRYYEIRTMVTVAALIALGVAFIWALGQGLGALADWWTEFFENLRI